MLGPITMLASSGFQHPQGASMARGGVFSKATLSANSADNTSVGFWNSAYTTKLLYPARSAYASSFSKGRSIGRKKRYPNSTTMDASTPSQMPLSFSSLTISATNTDGVGVLASASDGCGWNVVARTLSQGAPCTRQTHRSRWRWWRWRQSCMRLLPCSRRMIRPAGTVIRRGGRVEIACARNQSIRSMKSRSFRR